MKYIKLTGRNTNKYWIKAEEILSITLRDDLGITTVHLHGYFFNVNETPEEIISLIEKT